MNRMCKTEERFVSNCLGIFLSSLLLAGCAGHPVVQGPNAIVCWGDSMTEGEDGIIDIGGRQGGVPSYVTVQGGTIPAQGE